MTDKQERATAIGLTHRLGKEIKIDNVGGGFIRVVDYMGNDDAIVQAARVSYGAGTKEVKDDEQLIKYLIHHNHMSPFEMCEIKFHIKLPIFVARQLLRHRTASVNEISARYSIIASEFHIPDSDRIQLQSKANKQGSGGGSDALATEGMRADIEESGREAFELYEDLLEAGLARETARGVLPVSTFTELYWKIDLRNLLNVISLRQAKNAQPEIKGYADALSHCVRDWVPRTFWAWMNYRVWGCNLSHDEQNIILSALRGEEIEKKRFPLSEREWRELDEKLNLLRPSKPFHLTFTDT